MALGPVRGRRAGLGWGDYLWHALSIQEHDSLQKLPSTAHHWPSLGPKSPCPMLEVLLQAHSSQVDWFVIHEVKYMN